MRSLRRTMSCLCVAGTLLAAATSQAALSFNWTNRASAGFSLAEQAVVDAAFSIWTALLPTPEPRTMTLNIGQAPLPDALGETFDFDDDPLGNPVAASITIDSSTSYFVDPTPLDNAEYVPSGSPAHFNAVSGGAVGNWDLLSVVVHEVAHAIGFADNYDRFYARTDSDLNYIGDGFTAVLADGGHLDSETDLMGLPGFGESERSLPSPIDVAILLDAFDYADKRIFRYTGAAAALADSATTNVVLSVPQDFTVEDVDTAFFIQHNNDNHLDVTLISPQGTRVLLTSDNGGSGNDYGEAELWTRMDDQAIEAAVVDYEDPFPGTYSPEGTLADFNGQSSLGEWTLEIIDDTNGSAGTLQDFALVFKASLPNFAADFDGDHDVDGDDLAEWRLDFGTDGGVTADPDSDTDGADFLIWQQQFASGVLPADASLAVPEPSACLLVVGLAAPLFSLPSRHGRPVL